MSETEVLGAVARGMTEKVLEETEHQRRGSAAPAPPIRFALAIPHTPWKPERVESFHRLVNALGCASLAVGPGFYVDERPGARLVVARAFTDRAPPHVWAEQLLHWGLAVDDPGESEEPVTHLVQLQDDVIPAPNFWAAAAALVEAYPNELIGLETAHQTAPALAADPEDTVRIVTTSDGLIGVGWIMPIALVREFLAWRATQLQPGAVEAITEDTLMGVWCLATGRRVFHPIPTIIDHDVSLESTYGNDAHANRRPLVRWDNAAAFGDAWDARELEAPNFWRGGRVRLPHYAPDGVTSLGMRTMYNSDPDGPAKAVRHLGRFYDVTPALARTWVKGFDAKRFRAARADDGQRELRRIAILRSAKRRQRARERVLVCTPTRGGAPPQYTAGMTALVRLFELDLDNGLELLDSWQWHEDVVRVRSRFLRRALETDCTVIHWRDADIATGGTVVLGMLRTGKDFVCAPYPARDEIQWARMAAMVAAGDTRSLEALSHQYKIGPLPDRPPAFDATGCAEVEWMPLGCSILRRAAAEQVLEYYDAIGREELDLAHMRDTEGCGNRELRQRIGDLALELEQWRAGHRGLHYWDKMNDGTDEETVGVFQLLCRPSAVTGQRRLYSEDQSFCLRAADAGVATWMYLGPGSPVGHVGEHVYQGALESFGFTRNLVPPAAPRSRLNDAEAFALDTPEDPAREPEEPATP